ncbi:MAG: hypothetical protein HXS44_14790 [Theionarchaea archaeon]|nr:hypothetical protein [Theionarchaea archaeon]
MHITFRKIKSALYFTFWIVFVMGILMMWFHSFGDYIYEYALPLICGCAVGVLSGFSPGRAFLACFCGFLIISTVALLLSRILSDSFRFSHFWAFSVD